MEFGTIVHMFLSSLAAVAYVKG